MQGLSLAENTFTTAYLCFRLPGYTAMPTEKAGSKKSDSLAEAGESDFFPSGFPRRM
jgi:hypothetical protein